MNTESISLRAVTRALPPLLLTLTTILTSLSPSSSTYAAQLLPNSLTIGVLSLPASLNPLIDARPATADITDALFDSMLSADDDTAILRVADNNLAGLSAFIEVWRFAVAHF